MRRAVEWSRGVGEVVEQTDRFPLVMVTADMPRLGEPHRRAAVDDLQGGADVAIGPTFDGGVYLLALAGPRPEVLAAFPDGTAMMAAAREQRLEIGLLRPERAIRTLDDRRALIADPLVAAQIRTLLSPEGMPGGPKAPRPRTDP